MPAGGRISPEPGTSFDAAGRQVIDPTTLTTAASDKMERRFDDALRQLEEATRREIASLKDVFNERFNTHAEKFIGIEKQFTERDTRTEQLSLASKVAVDAALQAAKEAVGEQNKMNSASIAKSEAGFTKQIDQIGQLIAQQDKGSSDKIDDIKTRVGAIENRGLGLSSALGWVVGAIGLVVSIALLVMQVMSNGAVKP